MYDYYQDPIFKGREVLAPDYVPDHLPNRMDEIGFISQIINEFLKGKTCHVFIHGTPGTGKTASIKYMFNKLTEDAEAMVSYVNCFNKNTRMGVLHSIFLDFFKKKRPTRRMPSRRGISYDELLDSFKQELSKTKTNLVVCLDEVDQLKEDKIIYDLTRSEIPIEIITISNNPFAFKDMDPRTKSSFYPLEEMSFKPYNTEEMIEIIKQRVELAFQKNVFSKEAIEYLANFTADKKGDVRIARETLLGSGELAKKRGEERVDKEHVIETLEKSRHAKSIKLASELSKEEKNIIKKIPEDGIHYQDFFREYKKDGKLKDRMIRNYIKKFKEMNLIKMERKGKGGSHFITFKTPKKLLFGNN